MKMQESDYVTFQRACAILAEKLKATREEVSLWAWLGKKCGGIDAYSSPRPSICSKADDCNDFNPEPCCGFAPPGLYVLWPERDVADGELPWAWLSDGYFLGRDVETFNPAQTGRYITWGQLLARWGAYGLSEKEVLSKVRARIRDGELTDMAPVFGSTEISGLQTAPMEWAMFPLADVEAIEARDFPATTASAVKVGAGTTAVSNLPEGIPTGIIVARFKLTDAWHSKLTHLKGHPFLKDALMRKGCRQEGNRRRMPHLWNPVRLAEILIKRAGKNRLAMETVIRNHFPDWQDVWDKSMESDEAEEYAA